MSTIAFYAPMKPPDDPVPSGDRTTPNESWLRRWRVDRPLTFQALMYERARVILAGDDEIDQGDPQIVWLRRYGEQGAAWARIWSERDRRQALADHLDWLQSDPLTDGSSVPFHREAETFRRTFDELIRVYDEAMEARNQKAVRGRGESW